MTDFSTVLTRFHISRSTTDEELEAFVDLLCEHDAIFKAVQCERGWRITATSERGFDDAYNDAMARMEWPA